MNVARVRGWQFSQVSQTLTQRDCRLYALSIGMGRDPLDAAELPFVAADPVRVFPTMGSVLGWSDRWLFDPENEIDWTRAVHGETRMSFHAPFRAGMPIVSQTKVTDIVDKGAGKGALVLLQTRLLDAADGDLLSVIENSVYCRGDGGFAEKPLHASPAPPDEDRPPDETLEVPTCLSDALLYCLNGDHNPIHWDPRIARDAGFPRPILHGLCTVGIVARRLVRHYRAGQADSLRLMSCRFSAPVLPGDTLRIEIRRHQTAIMFKVRSAHQHVLVLNRGVLEFSA
jgi:acyl dehydratase